MNKQLTIILLLLPLVVFSTVISADVWEKWESFNEENKDNEGIEDFVWKEGSNKMPAYPQDDDLLEVAGPPTYQNYQYLIDGENLISGADGVVRYALVIRSKSGADNAMYDGIRCITNQIKHYAYGSTGMDGKKKFIQKTSSSWQRFRSDGVTGYGQILAANYFCDFNGFPLKRDVIIQNIKYGKGTVDGYYD